MSAPFFGEVFTFTQPDGAPFQVRGWGDQFSARFETVEGLPIARNGATGYYEYVTPAGDDQAMESSGVRADSAAPANIRSLAAANGSGVSNAPLQNNAGLPRGTSRWEERRRESLDSVNGVAGPANGILPAPPQRETVGDYVGLCILVDFPDMPGTITPQEVEAFCNQPGYSGFDNNGSVYDYFFDNSLGRVRYTNVVTPYYRANHPRAYYMDESIPLPLRAMELIDEALLHLQANGFDFSALTTDAEGFVYAVNVFYAGHRLNNWSFGLWPHQYSLQVPFSLAPGKIARDYQITDIGSQLSLGTFCHENGHMLCDFPDLYDYQGDSAGIGTYCLMCAGGGALETQKNPTQVGAYLKAWAGWASSVTKITDGMNGVATAGDNSFFIHVKQGTTEYFLVENRMKTGRDEFLRDAGLAIWHIDHGGNNSLQGGTPTLHYECALMQADGRNDLEKNQNLGDNSDLFDAGSNALFGDSTVPNSKWWDRTPSGLLIHSIGAAGPQIQFSARVQ